MVAGGKAAGSEGVEGVVDNGGGGFDGEAASPKFRAEMEAEFRDVLLRAVGAEPAAADVLVGIEGMNIAQRILAQVDGPILKIVQAHALDFGGELFGDGVVGERTTEEAGDLGVGPELTGEREIGGSPAAETEARGGEEVGVGSRSVHARIVASNWRRARMQKRHAGQPACDGAEFPYTGKGAEIRADKVEKRVQCGRSV